MNVLIVEDDESVSRFLDQAMSEAGFETTVSYDGLKALDILRSQTFDIVLLDVMLPGLDGFEVVKRTRSAGIQTPVLMLTAKDMTGDKVTGLDSGADDYLAKPFQITELLARIRALLRRGTANPGLLKVKGLNLDPITRKVVCDDRLVYLSATEFSLLEYLMRNAGMVLTRQSLLQHVWNYDFDGNDNVLDVYISYLRKKLDRGASPSIIQTVRGIGYRVGGEDAA